MDGWMDGWMNGWKPLGSSVPSRHRTTSLGEAVVVIHAAPACLREVLACMVDEQIEPPRKEDWLGDRRWAARGQRGHEHGYR